MNIRHIYWFCYFNDSEPSVRYRAIYALKELKQQYGISYSIAFPGYKAKNIIQFLNVYFSALVFRKKKSVIVFQKIHTNRIYSFLLRILLIFRKKDTLYDIDDADYLRFPQSVIHQFMVGCSSCSVGSRTLLSYTKQFNSNSFLLTSPVIEHGKFKKKKNTIFTIGWIGYFNAHQDNLYNLCFPVILELKFEVKIVLLGVVYEEHKKAIIDYFSGNEQIKVEMPTIDWHNELTVYEAISEFDIGLSPLLDTEFNQAKSAFKLKQYLSCGVPVLASNIGENEHFLKNGFNGFHCNSNSEYKEKIIYINNMNEIEYMQISTNALKSIKYFDMQSYCKTFTEFF